MSHPDYEVLPREDLLLLRSLFGFVNAPVRAETAPDLFDRWVKSLDKRQRQLSAYFVDRELPSAVPAAEPVSDAQTQYWRDLRARLAD